MGSKDGKKRKKKTANEGKDVNGSGEVDERFAFAKSDPRFTEAPRRKAKVVIDSRFQHVFTDQRFTSSNAPVDKRGKPVNKNDKKALASLKHYYRIQEEGGEEEEEGKDSDAEIANIVDDAENESERSEDESQRSDESVSTSSTESDSEDEIMDDEEEDTFLPQEETVPEIEKETHRLAVVNLDWSQVRAADLYVLLSSFLPKGGQIMSVTVYPSEFGLKRMEEEAIHGPVGVFDDDDDNDEEEDGELDTKKLRAYELSRLRYYFAVVECNSIATADYIYKTCDGVEFERSANKLDLRFIPDSMNFNHQPRDVATEAPADYEGTDFQTRALQHSNVCLTWDEDEPQRTKILNRKLNAEQLSELEFKGFLASDDSETDEDDNIDSTYDSSMNKKQKREMYRALIQSGDGSDDQHDDDENQEMEVTFNSGLEDISKRILEKRDKESETVWDQYLRKRKEKKKARKTRSEYSSEDENSDNPDNELQEEQDDFFIDDSSSMKNKGDQDRSRKRGSADQLTTQGAEATREELELLLADDTGANRILKGYNLKPKKDSKKRKKIPDEGKIPTQELDDPRFTGMLTSPSFALDPTDPQFKRSAAYFRQIAQRRKIAQENSPIEHIDIPAQASEPQNGNEDELPQRKENLGLASLIKSIKMKSKRAFSSSQEKVSMKHRLVGHKTRK